MPDRRRAIASWKRDFGPNMELNTLNASQRIDEDTWNRMPRLPGRAGPSDTERNRSPSGAITTSSLQLAPVSEGGSR